VICERSALEERQARGQPEVCDAQLADGRERDENPVAPQSELQRGGPFDIPHR
jgi:hypothetical protein